MCGRLRKWLSLTHLLVLSHFGFEDVKPIAVSLMDEEGAEFFVRFCASSIK